jgi:hypothetical protein
VAVRVDQLDEGARGASEPPLIRLLDPAWPATSPASYGGPSFLAYAAVSGPAEPVIISTEPDSCIIWAESSQVPPAARIGARWQPLRRDAETLPGAQLRMDGGLAPGDPPVTVPADELQPPLVAPVDVIAQHQLGGVSSMRGTGAVLGDAAEPERLAVDAQVRLGLADGAGEAASGIAAWRLLRGQLLGGGSWVPHGWRQLP